MLNKQQNGRVLRGWFELQFGSPAVLAKTKQPFVIVNGYEGILKLGNNMAFLLNLIISVNLLLLLNNNS